MIVDLLKILNNWTFSKFSTNKGKEMNYSKHYIIIKLNQHVIGALN